MKFSTKKAISMLLISIMAMTFMMPVVFAKPDKIPPGFFKGKASWKVVFSDVDETLEWARLAIDRLYAKDVFTGYPGGIFKPKDNVTHVEAIIMALRVMGWEDEAKNLKTIPDYVKKIDLSWNEAYYYVALAVEKGLIKPEELRGFNPNTPAKRYEVARYIVRAIDKEDEAQRHMDKKLSFKDASAIPRDAVGYVYVVVDMDLMVGDSNNKFKPQEPITRAEMAVLLNRLDDSVDYEDKDELVGTIKGIDLKKLTITINNSSGTKTYDIKEDAPVYLDKKYGDLEDLRIGYKVELVLDKNNKVIFIRTIKKSDTVTSREKGLVIDVNKSKETITLFTKDKKVKNGYYGTLKVSYIEGRHYELETDNGRYVLTGAPKDIEDYVGDKIVVIGELSDGVSIYMRGPIIEIDDFYPVRDKDTVKFDVARRAKIIIDGKDNYDLSDIKVGDYVEVKAEDGVASEIRVETSKAEDPKEITVSAKGLVTEVNERNKTLSLVTYIKDVEEGFVGTLKESNIEGFHYELKTEQGTFVLVGKTKGMDEYVGDKIVVIGDLEDDASIYMRGPIIDVEDFFPLKARDLVTFDVNNNTKIYVDGKKAKLGNIKSGDFAKVEGNKDRQALEIDAKSLEKLIRDRLEDGEEIKDGKIKGKIISISLKSQWEITVETNKGKRYTFSIDKDVKLEGIKKLNDLKKGMELELRIKNDKIVKIEIDD